MIRSPLISVAQLQAKLAEAPADWVVLDCRFNLADVNAGETAWQQGHIPGAQYVHLDRDLSGMKTGQNGRHPLPSPDQFASSLKGWGIDANTSVVAYDDTGGMFAARLWWMLRHWLGFASVQVLDGGWQAWLSAGADISTQAPTRRSSAGMPSWSTPNDDAVVKLDEVLSNIQNSGPLQLIDARAADRFAGQNETMDPIGGHIPGAINRFFKLNVQDNGCFKSPELLREEFTHLMGVCPPNQIVHQCGSGVTACHNMLAMAVAGLHGSRLYAGSWSEWCANPSRPMST